MPSPTCTLKNGSIGFCDPMAGTILKQDLRLIMINENVEAVMFPRTRAVLNVCPFCGARILEVKA